MFLYILVLSILILVIVLLLSFRQNKSESQKNDNLTSDTTRPCPICQWPLKKRERVHSLVYRSEGDNIMHIYGCPYCYSDHPKSKYRSDTQRVCPSCRKTLSPGEFVIARLFEKRDKNHVHVLGCYRCRGKR